MQFFRDVIPALGHACASFKLGRKLSVVVAFTAFGLVAGASGIALLMAESDDDSLTAFALAPLPSTGAQSASPSAAADIPTVETVVASKGDRAPGVTPTIGGNSDEARQPDAVAVATEPPAAPEASAKQDSSPILIAPLPAALAPVPAALVASAPARDESTSNPTDAAPAALTEPAAPTAAPTKPRKTARRESHRGSRYQASSLWPFAPQRPFRLFW